LWTFYRKFRDLRFKFDAERQDGPTWLDDKEIARRDELIARLKSKPNPGLEINRDGLHQILLDEGWRAPDIQELFG